MNNGGVTQRRSKLKSPSCSSSPSFTASLQTNCLHSVVDPRRSLTSTSLTAARNNKLKRDAEDDDDDDDVEILDPLQHPVEKTVASSSSYSSSSKTLTFLPWNADAATSSSSASSSSLPPNIPIANLSIRDSPPSSQRVSSSPSSSSNHSLQNHSNNSAAAMETSNLSHHHSHHSSPARLPGGSSSSSTSSSPVLTHDHPYATSPLAGIQDVSGLNRLEVRE